MSKFLIQTHWAMIIYKQNTSFVLYKSHCILQVRSSVSLGLCARLLPTSGITTTMCWLMGVIRRLCHLYKLYWRECRKLDMPSRSQGKKGAFSFENRGLRKITLILHTLFSSAFFLKKITLKCVPKCLYDEMSVLVWAKVCWQWGADTLTESLLAL